MTRISESAFQKVCGLKGNPARTEYIRMPQGEITGALTGVELTPEGLALLAAMVEREEEEEQ